MANVKQKIIDKVQFDNNYYDPPLYTKNFIIYQIGDLMFKYNGFVPSHKQYYDIELSYLHSGAADFYTDEKKSCIIPNSIYISFKDDIHYINSEESYRFFYFAIDIREDSPYRKILDHLKMFFSSPQNRSLKTKSLELFYNNILYETLYKNEYYLDIIENEIVNILIMLYRKTRVEKSTNYKLNLKEGLAYSIANYIDKNYENIKLVNEIAEKFGYDYTYISSLFKSVMNKSLKTYLQEKKLGFAKKLLEEDTMSITKIAELLDYSTVQNFSRAFSEFYLISPKEYKKKFNKNC